MAQLLWNAPDTECTQSHSYSVENLFVLPISKPEIVFTVIIHIRQIPKFIFKNNYFC